MDKIANARDLQDELRRLLAYAESPNPSREKVAHELQVLAERVAAIVNPTPENIKLNRLDQLGDTAEDDVKGFKSSLAKYKSDPMKYKPQLENAIHYATGLFSKSKVMLRFLGVDGV